MKKTIILFCLLLFPIFAFGQDYHIPYLFIWDFLQVDSINSRAQVITSVLELTGSVSGGATFDNITVTDSAYIDKLTAEYLDVGGAGGTNYYRLSVFDNKAVSGSDNATNISSWNSWTGGSTGILRGLQFAATAGDEGAVDYFKIYGLDGSVYTGLLVNDGAASTQKAWTGTCASAIGIGGTVYNYTTSTGLITNAYGVYGQVNTTATGIVRNASGLRTGIVKATGTDAGQTHNAYGLYIEDNITASGGATNNAYAIYSSATDPSVLSGDLNLEGGKLYIDHGGNSGNMMVISNDKDATLDSTITVNSSGDVTANGFAADGFMTGMAFSTLDTDPTIALGANDCKRHIRINNDADAIDYTLPAAEKGLMVMFYDIAGGVITIDPYDGTDTIYLNGVSVGAGDAIDSPGAAGNCITLYAVDNTRWITLGRSGTWVDGGAD